MAKYLIKIDTVCMHAGISFTYLNFVNYEKPYYGAFECLGGIFFFNFCVPI